MQKKPLQLEIVYTSDFNLSCYYAAKVVETVAPKYREIMDWEKVFIMKEPGSKRYYELSVALYGEEMVNNQRVYAPIPSIFINGKMVFDRIPAVEELDEIIEIFISKDGLNEY